MGLYKDPYSRYGQLIYDMWRAVRLVVDTGIHYFGWSRQEAIDYFKDNAAKTEADIINEIDRYIGWPGQALAYKIGQLKMLELRAKAEGELGDRFDIRAFHDELLGAGAIPLDALENRMNQWIALKKRSSDHSAEGRCNTPSANSLQFPESCTRSPLSSHLRSPPRVKLAAP